MQGCKAARRFVLLFIAAGLFLATAGQVWAAGTFAELQALVNQVPEGGTLVLTQDYRCVSSGDAAATGGQGIRLSRAIVVEGQGHVLSGGGVSRVLHVEGVTGDRKVSLRDATVQEGGNVASGSGLFVAEGSNAEFRGCVFTKNGTVKGTHTADGGAIFVDSKASVRFVDCSVTDNLGADRAAGIYLKGNGILENCLFRNNRGGSRGGALYVDPGYQAPKRGGDWGGNVVMKNCSVLENTGGRGGGIYVNSENDKLNLFENCTISDNDVSANTVGNGGGFVFYNAKARLVNCTVTGNKAKNGGGIIVDVLSDVDLVNCTIAGNRATQGGGLYAHDGSHAEDTMKPVGQARLFGCLVVGNVSVAGSDDVQIHYSPNDDKNPDPALGPWVPRYDGQFSSEGYNLVGSLLSGDLTAFRQGTNQADVSAGQVLAYRDGAPDLRDNGGPVKTVALLAGGAGENRIPAGTALPGTDARGVLRPQGARGDVGAYETAHRSGGGCDAGMGLGSLAVLSVLPLMFLWRKRSS